MLYGTFHEKILIDDRKGEDLVMKGRLWRRALVICLCVALVMGCTPIQPINDLFTSRTKAAEVMTNYENGVFSVFTATSGAPSFDDEGYDKLVDGSNETKWCRNGESGSLEFHSSFPIFVTGYILTTANDTERNSGRNPVSWALKGKEKLTDTTWDVLSEEYNNNSLPARNYKSMEFSIESTGKKYQYFYFEYSQLKSGSVFQLAELKLLGSPDANNLGIGALDGVNDVYQWQNGSPIEVSYTVKDSQGETLTEGVDYEISITKENTAVTEVTDRGNYTITATAKEGSEYCGSISKSFRVIKILTMNEDGTYHVSNEADWGIFAESVEDGIDYSGKTVKLIEDIGTQENPITAMVGDGSNRFRGTFDGGGHTITYDYNTTQDYTAPFRYTENATIKDLNVAGKIKTSKNYGGGLIGNHRMSFHCDIGILLLRLRLPRRVCRKCPRKNDFFR